MRLWSWVKSVPGFLKRNKSKILRRLGIYLVIMLMIFPFVFVNRTEIYRTFLTRYDDWVETIDENGIPITDYGYQAGAYIGPQTTIRMVGNLGLEYYNQFLEGNSTAGLYFNNTVDWILEKRNVVGIPTENGTIQLSNWPYDFAIYDLPKGWLSSMVEAKALHTLALHYGLYGNSSFLAIFEQIATTFETPVSQGGDLLILDDGTHWYPEIVVTPELNPDYESPLILNGFLIALHHIYQANLILNNSRLTQVFNLGVISAAQNLYKYDLPYNWT
ncbi:MAG: D-glucuronyl C5-epimerase family protein, partial [Promethearchaeota archaeon]